MIERLRGAVLEDSGGAIVVEVGGVGFRVRVSAGAASALPPVGGETSLVVRTLVHREDGFVLYGFASADEAEMFDRLRAVSGVGPAVALNLLGLTPGGLREAILGKQVKRLTTAPGVGLRLARRVITELAESLPDDLGAGPEPAAPTPDEVRRRDLVSAFLNLQFSDRRRIEEVVSTVLAENPGADFASHFRAGITRLAARSGS